MSKSTTQNAAATLGKLGGSAKTEAKASASRENGKKGGRPSKRKFYEISYSLSKENYGRSCCEMIKAETRPVAKDYKQKLIAQYPGYKITGVKVRQR
jgi:hypothetical protein